MQRAVIVLVRRDREVSRWPLDCERVDLDIVDHLARTRLAAQRLGCTIRLERVCPHLRGLLDLVGLDDL